MVYGLLGASLILTFLTLPFILRMYWHSPCHNLLAYRVPIVGIFWGRGGYMQTWLTGGATQIQKRVILVLCQIIDSPHVFITVLHWHSYQVRWGLFTTEYIYRIGRAGWLSNPFNFYDRQKSRCTRRRRFDLQATS